MPDENIREEINITGNTTNHTNMLFTHTIIITNPQFPTNAKTWKDQVMDDEQVRALTEAWGSRSVGSAGSGSGAAPAAPVAPVAPAALAAKAAPAVKVPAVPAVPVVSAVSVVSTMSHSASAAASSAGMGKVAGKRNKPPSGPGRQ